MLNLFRNYMNNRDELKIAYPQYRLIIKTPRLELKIPTELEILDLAKVAEEGIQIPDEPHFQDESLYNKPAEIIKLNLVESIIHNIQDWDKDNWQLPLGVFYENKPIGMQTIYAKQFPIARGFGCGYWIGLKYQGKGFGTEILKAILAFGFDGLNAREAYLGAWADNSASIHIMEKIGFIPNGEYWLERDGKATKDKRMRLPKEHWNKQNDVVFEGLDSCTELFGLSQ